MTDVMNGLVATIAFAGVGFVLLVLGFYLVDLLTPGNLARLIFVEHRRDPSVVLAAALGSLGLIVATAIYTAEADTWTNLFATAAYGLLGVVLLGIAFLLLDLITPGSLGELVTDESDDPGVWVTVAMLIAVGLIVSASLT